jgi:FHA domain-containing protein
MPKLIYHDSDGMDKVLMLGSEPVLIGRATECQVQTQDAMVSRRHARIFWEGNYWIEDLGSSNGVYVGNDKVQKAPIRPGDTVTCGSLVLRMVPDTSPRTTGNMAPMSTSAMSPARTGMTPPVGSAPLASTMPPPPSMPMAATMAPPPRAEVQIGPNAVLRGAVAAPGAMTGAQSSLADELRVERQRREHAEGAVLEAADRVRGAEARAAEFEAAAKEAALLKRKLDQAQADLRRMRGGGAPAGSDDTRDDAELTMLRGRVVELESQLAAAARSVAPAASSPPSSEEARLKRQVEQLQAELRRARPGAGEPVQMQSAPKPTTDPAAADAAIALGDSLAELRASLRAANDEAGLLTAPAESVEVVGEALRGAAEQLEAARGYLRALGKLLGVS